VRRTVLIFALAAACAGKQSATSTDLARSEKESGRKVPAELVKLSAIADSSHVGPDQELTVAVRLDIEPGWHIYWKNPGETGVRTAATLSAAPGFKAGVVRFPGPKRYEDDGIVSYGYEGTILLSAKVGAPSSLSSEPSKFAWSLEWLACREACVPGKGAAEIVVGAASESSPSSPTNSDLFARHDAKLPRPLSDLKTARHDWRENRSGHGLVVYIDGAETAEFFPERDLQQGLSGQALVPGQGVGALHLSFRRAPERVRGVLYARDKVKEYYFAVDLPGPQTHGATK